MSTGVKVLLGCLGLAAVGMIVLAVGLAVGGFALKRTVESAVGGMDDHREATETLRRLEADHPFEVPEDGIVSEGRLERFLAATDRAYDELDSWTEETRALRERSGSGEPPGLRDLLSGARSLAGGARARIVLAEALEFAEMSLGEYVWTGLTMDRAAKAVATSSAPEGIPGANLDLADRYGDRIPRFNARDPAGSDEQSGRGSVLAVAVLWGMAELPTWQALGLDSLQARANR